MKILKVVGVDNEITQIGIFTEEESLWVKNWNQRYDDPDRPVIRPIDDLIIYCDDNDLIEIIMKDHIGFTTVL